MQSIEIKVNSQSKIHSRKATEFSKKNSKNKFEKKQEERGKTEKTAIICR